MKNHATAASGEYHFESSDEFCELRMIEKAAAWVKAHLSLSDADAAQLEAIVKLERMRFGYATGDQPLSEHGAEIQRVRKELISHFGREPFDNGVIDKAFYSALNKEYGYVE